MPSSTITRVQKPRVSSTVKNTRTCTRTRKSTSTNTLLKAIQTTTADLNLKPKTPKPPSTTTTTTTPTDPLILKSLHRISTHPSLTPYRRLVYRTLLSIPRGHWTTYSALATHLSSSARAIGNAMRTNPFAPDVPCHRVLAADRTVGGYKGSWGNGGVYRDEKMGLLSGEGVAFDEKGRVGGRCFVEFRDLGEGE
ncbi:hypothetical protein AJ80_04075 [Polytolypa hystricis UAMH7299]|uniref:Methylated-DNA--protein-cysteine methyltransferase n=1 Tax=Polytolypa hystricis (strain UAMH7299) TaxID=1447883 RepID=A0A2B7YEL7_POLH7|nr:hypothetical protein AJ80_04075 [Polytolypa hystricis UAMH7299]